jgi:hypothetical protein
MAPSEAASPLTAADLRFLRCFESCELPEAEWTHLAHVHVAWTCLQLDAPGVALARIREGILRYNTDVLHRRHKYHETVTVAFTHLVAVRIIAGEPWADFAERIGDLLDPGNPVLLRYYSGDRLFSDVARRQFVGPDLRELPAMRGGIQQTG